LKDNFQVDNPGGLLLKMSLFLSVPEAEEGEAEAALQYVEVPDDTEGAQTNLTDEGKPRCI
jgi:hypothetical protein